MKMQPCKRQVWLEFDPADRGFRVAVDDMEAELAVFRRSFDVRMGPDADIRDNSKPDARPFPERFRDFFDHLDFIEIVDDDRMEIVFDR